MILLPMYNLIKIQFILPILVASILASPCASADYKTPNCRLQGTPLESCENYTSYLPSDRELNSAYKTLSKSLDKSGFSLLKEKQRQWIKWRDSSCREQEEKSGCTNSSCNAVAHDECIIELTDQRALELRQYMNNPSEAAKQKFEFSRNSKLLDD